MCPMTLVYWVSLLASVLTWLSMCTRERKLRQSGGVRRDSKAPLSSQRVQNRTRYRGSGHPPEEERGGVGLVVAGKVVIVKHTQPEHCVVRTQTPLQRARVMWSEHWGEHRHVADGYEADDLHPAVVLVTRPRLDEKREQGERRGGGEESNLDEANG